MQSTCYCLYLDVLGFKERAREAMRTASLAAVMRPLHQAIKSTDARLRDRASWTKKRLWHWRFFTDNLLLWRISQSEDGQFEMGAIIQESSWVQLELAAAGFFTRGGLAHGELLWKTNFVVGEPLFAAVELEKSARYPRVLMAGDVIRKALEHAGEWTNISDAPQGEAFWRGPDDAVFLNYLDLLKDDWLTTEQKTVLLQNQRDHLAAQLHGNHGEAREKLLWLASYHNAWVDHHQLPAEFRVDLSATLGFRPLL